MQDFNQLARDLCHVDKPRRDASLEKVRGLVTNLESLPEFKKCWKALFYCFWMSDKMLIQQELAEKLGLMMNEKIYYLSGFWDIIAKEWHGIDRVRLNKFYYLIRTMHKATFNWIKASNWDLDVITEILKVLSEGPLNARDSKVPDGLRYHTIEVFFTILHQVEDKSEISLPAFKLLFSPFLLLLQNTSNLNIVSHILEDILDIYTKPDSELYEWMSTNLPAKEISEMIVDSLSKMPSKNNKMVQEYLKKWGSVVGIPFVDQIVITGMDVKKVYNGLEGGAKRDPPSVTNSLSKKPKLDIEKDQSQPIPNPKKKKDVVPKKVKNVGSEDVSGAHSKIPVPVVPVQAVSSNITTNGKKSPKRVSKKNELVEGVVKEGGGNQVVTPKTGKKGTLAAPLEPVVVAKLEEKIQQKKSPKTSKKPKVSAEIELSSSVQTTNGEAAHLIEAQKSPKKANEAKPVKSPKKPELEGQDSVESFESFDNLAEPSIEGSESSHSARSRNLARTIPADTIALLHKTLKSKKPKKKTVKKSKVELQVEQLFEESGFQSDTLEPVSMKKSKIIQELQETQSSPIPKKSVSWGPSDVKAFKKHETICSNEQAQHSPVITSSAPTILKAFEKPLIQEFTVPAKTSKRVTKGKKKGRK